MSSTSTNDFIDTLAQWFGKFPALPKNWQETLVKITPILALIFGILGILVGISGLGILSVFAPLAMLGGASGASTYGNGIIATIIFLIASVLLLAAYPGTRARKYKGWQLLFWSEVAYLIGRVIDLNGLLSAIIWALITLYILFQIRPYYK